MPSRGPGLPGCTCSHSGLYTETPKGHRVASHPGGLGPGHFLGSSMGCSGSGSGRRAPQAVRPWLGESAAVFGPQFSICKMGVILLGSDEVVIKCFAWCQARASFADTQQRWTGTSLLEMVTQLP